MQALDVGIAYRLKQLQTEIAALAAQEQGEITLVAVSKNKPISAIKEAIALGQYHFGENYLQEGLKKISFFQQEKYINLSWHYLGQIQSNKIAKIVEYFDVVHSLGSLPHAKLMAKSAMDQAKTMPVFLQVNFQEEEGKGGFAPAALEACLPELIQLPNLKLMGLMLIPRPNEASVQKKVFLQFQDYRHHLEHQFKINLAHLSMGMSADFKEAILAGADFIRIGTGIFGQR